MNDFQTDPCGLPSTARTPLPTAAPRPPFHLRRLLPFVALVLFLRITVGILLNYPDYFPPNFDSDFLLGRQPYFFGSYHWAFYAHLISGPVTLILGLILISNRFRERWPKWHRMLGRIQCLFILLVLTPSGLWMAQYVDLGPVPAAGFSVLALLTGLSAAMGWRSAVQRRFVSHRWWMSRCFVLLCSAIVLRLVAGFASLIRYEQEWIYVSSAWTSWLIPLALYELFQWKQSMKG
ncbi:DUF2306 domain-containing protein [Schlesneria sp. DSM 10557]|uniref:DUF2306 domain-containing protein n=1 Tax=Schlesneria sp. DSM 10557 TaxID=3044399 RepID=UPI0035A0A0F3